MSEPKLHHWVPQFYLRRFADPDGRIWAWDRRRDLIFPAGSKQIAGERHFYRMPELAKLGSDPLTMEKQLADLESNAAAITHKWLGCVRDMNPGDRMEIPVEDRETMALFIALQFYRTKDVRELLAAFDEAGGFITSPTEDGVRRNHMAALWTEDFYRSLVDRIERGAWVFGHNGTATPFMTSDNPVAFRTGDNTKWLRVALDSVGTYTVYPLAPDVLMYSFPDDPIYKNLKKFDGARSPKAFTEEEVKFENAGQAFMASRFVLSPRNDFEDVRAFRATIGTRPCPIPRV